MIRRALTIALLMVATSAYLVYAEREEPTQLRKPLEQLPLEMGHWSGRVEKPMSPEVLAVLRVDDYTRRTYGRPGGPWVGLYVGYHATQRQGASIHSPLNCLPGSGWTPVERGRMSLVVKDAPGGPDRRIEVNRVTIEKGLDRQLVAYWYQSHNRVIASEYWGKIYSVVDAVHLNRTDAALVRVVVPFAGQAGLATADAAAADFVRELFPRLGEHVPN